jgi:hypothetical protein
MRMASCQNWPVDDSEYEYVRELRDKFDLTD